MKPMKQIPAWIFIFVMFLLSGATNAEAAPQLPEPDLTWRNVTIDGKKTAVYCMIRDRRGIMWIGTNIGLYFYDGVNEISSWPLLLRNPIREACAAVASKKAVPAESGEQI